MEIISYDYSKRRDEFGHHPKFENSGVNSETIEKAPEAESQWVKKIASTVNLDCTPQLALHDVNTERFTIEHKATSHQEGAWPADMKTNDFADKQRLLRRIKNEPQYGRSVVSLAHTSETAIQQNNTIDLFEEYYGGQDDQEHFAAVEPPSTKTVSVFRDQSEVTREATSITWHPEGPHKLAVSYAIMQFQKSPEDMANVSYIWDVNNPNQPDQTLTPASPLVALEYNPRSPDHIVGGAYNGQVTFWDLRKGGSPTEASLLEHSHHDPVYDIFWIQSRTGNECVTTSTDGQLLWWDIRKLGSGPTDQMRLESADGFLYGGTCMEYKSEAGATKYLVGTEQGLVISCDRKAKKDAESQKSIKQTYGARTGQHHGPIYSVERNPYFSKYFLTVGDWTARVWMDDLQAPIMTTRYDKSYLTGGCWSTTRPGVFFTTKTDGTLDIWDLFHKQNEPTFSTKVGDCGLSCIKVQKQGGLVALGSTDGTISIVEISKGLSQPLHNEKQSIANMFEREQKREKNLELRLIQRERDQKIASKQKNTVKRLDPNADDAPATLEVLQKVEEAFYNAIEEDAKQAMAANNEELLEADKLAEEAAPAAAKSEPESADAAAVEPVADDAAETPAPTTE